MRRELFLALLVFRKEWRDAVRDKRAMRLAFLPALYFVAVFAGGVLFTLSLQKEHQVDGLVNVSVPVQGREHFPELINWLVEQGADIQPVETGAYERVANQELDFALIIPADVREQQLRGEQLTLWLVYDAANQKVHSRLGFVRAHIGAWGGRNSSLRLLAQGLSPELATTLQLRESNVASEQQMGVYILGSLPMILLLAVFIGSIGFSADMTAGERERRSLESLLITPASSLSIMLGKWLTSVLLTLAVLILTLGLLWTALAYLPFDQLGMRVDVGWAAMVNVFLTLLPVVLFAVAMQLAIAIFARSFKDAQTYVGLLVFIPMVPGFYTLFNPGVFHDWFLWVPILGQQVTIRELFLGGSLTAAALLRFWLVALILMLTFLAIAAKKLRSAKIIYG